jgi:hypothetical protein
VWTEDRVLGALIKHLKNVLRGEIVCEEINSII